MPLKVGERLGPYEVLSPLGAGGMGEVYRARDTRLSREVAIKVLPAEVAADASRLRRFEKEARSASALNHPNIVTIYDAGTSDGLSWIAMEKVDGKTLRELLFAGAFPIKKLLPIAAQIADGLARAHQEGIVHRDLKPENVMVTKEGLVKILDFGLAKLTSTGVGSDEGSHLPTETGTSPGLIVGTAGYMSPEQASGERVDFRTDQFSLGSIAYEMATGKRAFQKKTAVDTLGAIINEDPQPIAAINPEVPAPLRWIVERCLAKEPRNRYASTEDLARDLAGVRDRISEVTSGSMAAAPRPRQRLGALAVGLALIAVAAAAWLLRGRLTPPPEVPRFTRLTFRQGVVNYARFAPDGRTIVYGAYWHGDPRGATPSAVWLYRTQIGSPEYAKFGFQGDILAISPSNELAIMQDARGSEGTLARVQMSGGTPRQILEDVNYAGADFSPDGEDLVVAHLVDGKVRLELPIGKVLAEAGKYAFVPRFSRDGRLISFFEADADPGPLAISVVGRDGKGRRVLSGGWHKVWGAPCWSADGREIWFTASERPNSPTALWAVDLSGRRRLVMRLPGDIELDDVSKDGRALFLQMTYAWSMRFASASDPVERELSWLDGSNGLALSDDGRTVLFDEVGEGTGGKVQIYLRATDGSPAVRLGEGEGFAISPDGRWVLAKSPPAGAKPGRLFLLPIGPGRPIELGGDFADYSWGSFLPDSKSVAYSATAKDGSLRTYIQAISGGTPKAIGPEGFRLMRRCKAASPDGKFLVGRHEGKWVLVSRDGAAADRVIPGVSSEEGIRQWSKDGRHVYVSRFEGRVLRVWLQDLATGDRRIWKEFPFDPSLNGMGVVMTPDGDAWVIGSQKTHSQLYVVEGLR